MADADATESLVSSECSDDDGGLQFMDQVGFFVAVKRRAGGGQMELLGRFGWGEGRSSVLLVLGLREDVVHPFWGKWGTSIEKLDGLDQKLLICCCS